MYLARLITSNDTNLYFNETAGAEYIVASYNSSKEGESFYLKVDIVTDNNIEPVLYRTPL